MMKNSTRLNAMSAIATAGTPAAITRLRIFIANLDVQGLDEPGLLHGGTHARLFDL